MGISTTWDNEEKTILCTRIEGHWELGEFYAAFGELNEMTADISHQIFFIIDFEKSAEPPRKFLSTGGYIKDHAPDNIQLTIFVKPSRFVKVLMQTINRLVKSDAPGVVFADNMEEAVVMASQYK